MELVVSQVLECEVVNHSNDILEQSDNLKFPDEAIHNSLQRATRGKAKQPINAYRHVNERKQYIILCYGVVV
ncbi:unnamed protein product, partial [Brenthis ino]